MHKYSVLQSVGEGSFAVVRKAKHEDGSVVAIKTIKERQPSWEACLSMRELRSLKSMGRHANLVVLKELILDKDYLHFVFEFLPHNLHQTIRNAAPHGFSDSRVARMATGLLRGLAHMHSRGFSAVSANKLSRAWPQWARATLKPPTAWVRIAFRQCIET